MNKNEVPVLLTHIIIKIYGEFQQADRVCVMLESKVAVGFPKWR